MLSVSRMRVRLVGEEPGMIMHSTAGMDPSNNRVIELRGLAKKTASKRTDAEVARISELETLLSIYWREGRPTLPPANIRACVERAARTLKDGPRVRRGLQVVGTTFHCAAYSDDASESEIVKVTRFVTAVRVGRSSVMRTRALFWPWEATATFDVLDEHVDEAALERWLMIGGRMIGLGDWRPDTSGSYGRFLVEGIERL